MAMVTLIGCASGRAGEPGTSDGGKPSVKPMHGCDNACGHFMHNGSYYHIPNHVHGSNCGHHKINGVWHYAKPISGSGCKHSSYCGHYKYRGSWFYLADHTHGQGCGHYYREGEWKLED
jgi:glucan-binding YG repeat protein